MKAKVRRKDWMDWLHRVRADAKEERKEKGQALAEYLRAVEGKRERPKENEIGRARKKKK